MRANLFKGFGKAGFHAVHYVEWGDPAASRVALCVHGLTQNGRVFDRLAAALAESGWRVLCPDVVGRGRSDWLADPAEYGFPQYLADANALIARSGAVQVDWIGTSMGGLMGMTLAATSAHKPDESEFTAAILRLRNAGCDLVLMGTVHRDTILVL